MHGALEHGSSLLIIPSTAMYVDVCVCVGKRVCVFARACVTEELSSTHRCDVDDCFALEHLRSVCVCACLYTLTYT